MRGRAWSMLLLERKCFVGSWLRVIGSGDARKKALGANYAAVWARVNEMLGCGNSNGGGWT